MSLSLDQLLEVKVDTVYGASKYEQKLTEAPSAVSIVTEDDIKKYGYRTLTDVLRSVRGVYASYDRNYNYLGMRGFSRPGDYNSRALLLINGHRVNDSVYDTASIGTEFPVDVDLIDRVEVIRGPSSSIYGNNAFFGVINVITKEGRNLNGAETSAEAGSYGTYKGRFSFGQRFTNGVELLLSGSYYNSDGPGRLYFPAFDTATNNVNNGIAERADHDRAYQFFSSLSYRDFTLEGAFASREKRIPTGSYGVTFDDPRSRTIDEPGYLDLKFQHAFESDLEVTSRTYFDSYHYAGDYLYAPVVNKDFADGKRWGTEAQAIKKLFDRHTFIVGAEYRNHFQQDQRTYDLDPYASYLDDRRHNDNWAFYGQGDIAMLTNVVLNGGIRYDNYGLLGETLNPRLGLIMHPAEPATFKVLYGTAFRAPNVYELYYNDDGRTSKANPNLKPETISTYELVYEQQLSKSLRFGVSGYYYSISHLISQQLDPGDGLLAFGNLRRASARGVEMELEASHPSGFRGRVSYALQQTKDQQTGMELSNSPRHLAKLNVSVPLYREVLFSGLEVQYNGKVSSFLGARVDDFWVANLTLFSHQLMRGLDVSASVYNLFDARYGYPGGAEQMQDILSQNGRTFGLKLTYHF